MRGKMRGKMLEKENMGIWHVERECDDLGEFSILSIENCCGMFASEGGCVEIGPLQEDKAFWSVKEYFIKGDAA